MDRKFRELKISEKKLRKAEALWRKAGRAVLNDQKSRLTPPEQSTILAKLLSEALPEQVAWLASDGIFMLEAAVVVG